MMYVFIMILVTEMEKTIYFSISITMLMNYLSGINIITPVTKTALYL